MSLTYFKEPQTTKTESTTLEQTLTTATNGSEQPKLKMPEKTGPSVKSPEESENPSLTDHNLEYLRSIMRRDSASITIRKNADGSSTALLNGTFRTVSAAKRLPDGTLVTRCFENFDALEKFMTSPVTGSE